MMTMDNAPGWQPDPEGDDQERYWNGSAWTDRVRPAGRAGSLPVPEHAADLHTALSAATDDIDAVEDRLSTIFERSGGTAYPVTTAVSRTGDGSGDGDDSAGDDAAFAELDAALAAEEADDTEAPAKVTRSLFRRRARDTTP